MVSDCGDSRHGDNHEPWCTKYSFPGVLPVTYIVELTLTTFDGTDGPFTFTVNRDQAVTTSGFVTKPVPFETTLDPLFSL